MTPIALLGLATVIIGTSFLSGLFGMAGGIILVGALFLFMPVPAAMVLHAITQMASNGWRAILWWHYVRWSTVLSYIVGCMIALAVWSYFKYVPDVATALIFLGLTPFIVKALPSNLKPNPHSPRQRGAIQHWVHVSHAPHKSCRPSTGFVLPWRRHGSSTHHRIERDVPAVRARRKACLLWRNHRPVSPDRL